MVLRGYGWPECIKSDDDIGIPNISRRRQNIGCLVLDLSRKSFIAHEMKTEPAPVPYGTASLLNRRGRSQAQAFAQFRALLASVRNGMHKR